MLERFEISVIARQLSGCYENVLAKAGLSQV